MKKLIALVLTLLCCLSMVSAEAPATLEERIAALEERIAVLEELLRAALTPPAADGTEPGRSVIIPVKEPKYAEGAVWYQDAQKGITLECTAFYYNATNRGQIVWDFTVRNRSEHTVQFSAENVYIDGWLHSTAISTASMDKLAPGSNMKDMIMLTDLINGKIDGIDELSDIARVEEIRFELVVRIDGGISESIPVRITDLSTMEEKSWW